MDMIVADDVKATVVAGRRITQLPQRKVAATTVSRSHLSTTGLLAAESHGQKDIDDCKTQ